jgi:2-oxo-4-hydroxy-4-carboxy-5-ureidoimidazoline decarboxylase
MRQMRMAEFDDLPDAEAESALLACCAAPDWAAALTAGRPYGRRDALLTAADQVLAALADGNRAYEQRFGHVYLVCADGRPAAELLDVLRARLANDPATERAVLRTELGKINRIRLTRLLEDS